MILSTVGSAWSWMKRVHGRVRRGNIFPTQSRVFVFVTGCLCGGLAVALAGAIWGVWKDPSGQLPFISVLQIVVGVAVLYVGQIFFSRWRRDEEAVGSTATDLLAGAMSLLDGAVGRFDAADLKTPLSHDDGYRIVSDFSEARKAFAQLDEVLAYGKEQGVLVSGAQEESARAGQLLRYLHLETTKDIPADSFVPPDTAKQAVRTKHFDAKMGFLKLSIKLRAL